jgi:hypothetical protein
VIEKYQVKSYRYYCLGDPDKPLYWRGWRKNTTLICPRLKSPGMLTKAEAVVGTAGHSVTATLELFAFSAVT